MGLTSQLIWMEEELNKIDEELKFNLISEEF